MAPIKKKYGVSRAFSFAIRSSIHAKIPEIILRIFLVVVDAPDHSNQLQLPRLPRRAFSSGYT
jgi:hypothetical protein